MKALLRAAGVATLAVLGLMGVAKAQVSEPGPYYSAPSWDQQFPVSTRFIVLTNWASAAVLDRETGLVWEQSPSMATGSLELAQLRCMSLTTGGRGGWRLPRVEELTSLLPLPAGHPFSNVFGNGGNYWSISPWSAGFTGNAIVNGGEGIVNESDDVLAKDNNFGAWCVRGGGGSAGTSADH